MITNNEFYRKWYDSIAPTEPSQLITELKIQGLWYPPDVCGTVKTNICNTITDMVQISHKTGNETGTQVCRNTGGNNIITGPIIEGTKYGVSIPLNTCSDGYEPLGTLHTHPPYQELTGIPNHYPSPTDLESSLYSNIHTGCVISQPSGMGQCYTIRTAKAAHDAYSAAQGMTLDLEYRGKITPDTKQHVDTFLKQFGCEFTCK